ncbi:TAXI family TRAP transporter solute-binding subunit [Sulfitobacter sp. AS92]|uniref:TAXI family TRAP transporter solute-binding subunit n=1 Tax=Sulfitobacter sp. AS92 TaxID=3135783 RepID=UPI0031750429
MNLFKSAGCGLLMAFSADSALAQSNVTPPTPVMSASSQVGGSLYVTYVAAWIDVVSKAIPGLTITQEPGGSSQNIILVSTGETDFGITASSQAYLGYNGLAWAEEQYRDFVGLHPAFPTYMTIVTLADSGIESVEDLAGKELAVGVPGGGSDTIARELTDYLDIDPARYVNASWEDTGGLLRDGLADAILYIAGHPAGFLQELEVNRELHFLQLSDEQISGFLDAYPYYAPVSLSADTYGGLSSDLQTIGQMNFMIGTSDLPDDFVVAILDAVYANTDRLAQAHPNFSETRLENVRGIPTPIHPAASAYYENLGVEMRLAPPPAQ